MPPITRDSAVGKKDTNADRRHPDLGAFTGRFRDGEWYECVPDRRRERRDLVKTGREKAEEKRAAKLEAVREQVENGSLVIRQMTDEERRRYPPRPVDPKRGRRR